MREASWDLCELVVSNKYAVVHYLPAAIICIGSRLYPPLFCQWHHLLSKTSGGMMNEHLFKGFVVVQHTIITDDISILPSHEDVFYLSDIQPGSSRSDYAFDFRGNFLCMFILNKT